MESEDCAGVLKGLCSLREKEVLLDFTIEVEDQEFKVHKVVMASVSDYFKAMVTGGMVESQTDKVRLEGLKATAVSDMIDFIYKGCRFCDADASLEDLTECAAYLQIPTALQDCISCAEDRVDDDWLDSFQILSLFQKFSVKDGIKRISEWMRSHCDEIMEVLTPEEMSHEDIMNLIDIWQNSEWDLFFNIKQWVEADIENHQKYVSSLLSQIRFGLMTPGQLELVKGSDLYSKFDGSWHKHVDVALEYHNLLTHQKVLDDAKQNMVRKEADPFTFVHDGMLFELRGAKDQVRWQRLLTSEPSDFYSEIDTFVVANNFLIVCDVSVDRNWHILDPRMMKWSSMAKPGTPRLDSALVSCHKHLYLLGGCPPGATEVTDTIEMYDFQSNSWSTASSKLPVPLHKHGAAVIGDCIYVAGGVTSGGEYSKRLDCFETSTNTWHKKADLTRDEDYRKLDVMDIDNEKVLFLMSEDSVSIHYYSPSTDEWCGWNCGRDVQGRTRLRSERFSSVLYRHSELFLFNFHEWKPRSERMDDDSDDDESDYGQDAPVSRACARWVIDPESKAIREWKLVEVPDERVSNIRVDKLMLLAVQPRPYLPVKM